MFKTLWKDIASNLDLYKGYPRIVGETGGKNWHVIHKSAELRNAVLQSVRGAFEYQGMLYIFGSWVDELISVSRSKVFRTFEALCFEVCLGEWVQDSIP